MLPVAALVGRLLAAPVASAALRGGAKLAARAAVRMPALARVGRGAEKLGERAAATVRQPPLSVLRQPPRPGQVPEPNWVQKLIGQRQPTTGESPSSFRSLLNRIAQPQKVEIRQAAAPTRMDWGAKDLFKRAFTREGMTSPQELLRQDQERAAEGQAQTNEEAQPRYFGMIAKTSLALVGGLGAAVKAVHAFGNAMLAERASLAKYSGQIAAAMGRLEVRRMGLAIQSAQRTSRTTKDLAGAVGDLETQMQPMKDAFTNIKNAWVVGASTIAGSLMKAVNKTGLFDAINKALGGGAPQQMMPIQTLINDIASGKFSGRKNPGPRNPEPARRNW